VFIQYTACSGVGSGLTISIDLVELGGEAVPALKYEPIPFGDVFVASMPDLWRMKARAFVVTRPGEKDEIFHHFKWLTVQMERNNVEYDPVELLDMILAERTNSRDYMCDRLKISKTSPKMPRTSSPLPSPPHSALCGYQTPRSHDHQSNGPSTKMSLFGGEDSVPHSASSLHELSDSPIPVISSWTDAHNAQPVSYTLDADDEDDEDDLNETESDLDPDQNATRPNRFAGKRTTWQRYTAADRQIAASLDQIQSGDLAAHLYNTHALKRRVRLPAEQLTSIKDWQSKDLWMKKGKSLDYIDVLREVQTELVPHKRWTAWPLPTAMVPALHERFGRKRSEDEDDGWAIGGLGEQDAGDELREELLAVILRLAKENYKSRRYEPQNSAEHERNPRPLSRSRSTPRSKSTRSSRSPSTKLDIRQVESDIEMKDGDGVKADDDSTSQSDSEEKWQHAIGHKYKREPQVPFRQPAILADDDKARRILQPTINSLLSQLDDVAVAIRRTRLNHFGRGIGSDTSGSEGVSEVGSTSAGSGSKSRSRSRSVASTRLNARTSSRAPPVPKTRAPPKARKPTQKLRTQDLADSDDASDYGAEFEAKKTIQSENSSSTPPKRNRSKSRGGGDSDSSFMQQEASVQVGLLDWSEVLGIASMTGWNSQAVARTAQRCAALFGEGMTFRSFDERLAMKPVAEPVQYELNTLSRRDDLGMENGKRPFFQKGMLNCPHTDCPDHDRKFKISYRVIEHVQRIHGYDPRTNDSDNEEDRTYGGVHTDGFLLPIHAQRGWLGGGRAKSAAEKGNAGAKKEKKEEESGSISPILVESSPTR
jgi:hypothetical protein